MSKLQQGPLSALDYQRAADEYLQSLPLEHFMEAIPQSTQRKITLESLDLLCAHCPEVQLFNELLVQYLFEGKLVHVVPDNMLVKSSQPIQAVGSFNVELEPAKPFLVMEYVSPSSQRKDYEESFQKYEHELRVPYCLMVYPEKQDLRVYQHTGKRYKKVAANARGRYPIPELDLEAAIVDGWVRFWYQGRLLELPGELEKRAETAEAEVARLKALLAEKQIPRQP